MPRFSLIIPVFRAEKYIRACLDSIVCQNYKDFELILIDDGSDDTSPMICDLYAKKDTRITVIHQKNSGVVKARQAGVEISKGEYIVPIDSDDYISANYLEVFNEIIELNHPDIVMSSYYEGSDNCWKEMPLTLREGYYNKKQIAESIYPQLICDKRGRFVVPMLWGKVFLASLYKKYQLVDKFVCMGEDSACLIPMIYHANSFYVEYNPGYYYRNNPESVTKKKKEYPFDGPLIRAEHIKKYINLEDYDFLSQYSRMIVLAVYTVVSSRFWSNKSYFNVKNDVKEYLNNPIIKSAIEKSDFSVFKPNLNFRRYVLKNRFFLGIKIINAIHK